MAVLTDKQFYIVGGVAAGAAIIGGWYLKKKSVEVLHEVSPLNHDNVFSSGVNDVGAVLTGVQPGDFSLGSWVYDITHEEYQP